MLDSLTVEQSVSPLGHRRLPCHKVPKWRHNSPVLFGAIYLARGIDPVAHLN
jgi:hypothetical protein